MEKQGFCGTDENNNFHTQKFDDGDQVGGCDKNEELYDMSSDEETFLDGKMRGGKSELFEDEGQSDYADPTKIKLDEAKGMMLEGKPTQSYIALIAMAILSSSERKMVLSDIYKYIIENYPFYKTQDKSWRNSIRHNLSLNECFMKAGRSENGKGNYWAIHPSNVEDFSKGDYRRRRARRKTKRSPHPFGLYSEFFQPYPVLSPIYRFNRKMLPYLLNGCEARCDLDLKINKLFPKQKQKKSFTIDSILGIEKDKKLEASPAADNQTNSNTRRHHSTPSYVDPRSPYEYEGSAFSPVYRQVNTTDFYPAYALPADYYRRPEYFPYGVLNARESLQELSRLRKSLS